MDGLSLYQQIYDLENVYKASKKAMKGKKSKPHIAKWWLNEDANVLNIHNELKDKSYNFGRYTEFIINDRVQRKISAAPFKDRVTHHAITNILEPIFEKSFIYDSYSNRKYKGVSNGLKRAKYFSNKFKYILKLDIKKYFPSIVQDVLIKQISKKVQDEDTLDLCKNLINNSNKQDEIINYVKGDNLFTPIEIKKGLPLGNQTSQFFGNIYLNDFDHFVKEKLRIKGYIRYVDDMIFFHNDKDFLENIIEKLQFFLDAFRLKIHPLKTKLVSTEKGFEFLGHKVYKTHFRVTNRGIKRARKNLKKIRYEYMYKKIDLNKAKNKIFSNIGFLNIGKGYKVSSLLLAKTSLIKRDF